VPGDLPPGYLLNGQPLKSTSTNTAQAFAGITQPNEASNSVHRSSGVQDAVLTDASHDGLDGPSGRFRWPRPAPSGPLRNRQGAIPFTAGLPR
jgi:hypothetical protein